MLIKIYNELGSNNISILPLISELEFIPNKKMGYPFRLDTLQINEQDFQLISNLMVDGQNG